MDALQIVKKHAFGGFLTNYAPFAYEPSARRAANGDRNAYFVSFRNHRKGERSEPRREDSAKRSAEPKPKTGRRLGLGRNACRWFRIVVRGLRPSDTSRRGFEAYPQRLLMNALFSLSPNNGYRIFNSKVMVPSWPP